MKRKTQILMGFLILTFAGAGIWYFSSFTKTQNMKGFLQPPPPTSVPSSPLPPPPPPPKVDVYSDDIGFVGRLLPGRTQMLSKFRFVTNEPMQAHLPPSTYKLVSTAPNRGLPAEFLTNVELLEINYDGETILGTLNGIRRDGYLDFENVSGISLNPLDIISERTYAIRATIRSDAGQYQDFYDKELAIKIVEASEFNGGDYENFFDTDEFKAKTDPPFQGSTFLTQLPPPPSLFFNITGLQGEQSVLQNTPHIALGTVNLTAENSPVALNKINLQLDGDAIFNTDVNNMMLVEGGDMILSRGSFNSSINQIEFPFAAGFLIRPGLIRNLAIEADIPSTARIDKNFAAKITAVSQVTANSEVRANMSLPLFGTRFRIAPPPSIVAAPSQTAAYSQSTAQGRLVLNAQVSATSNVARGTRGVQFAKLNFTANGGRVMIDKLKITGTQIGGTYLNDFVSASSLKFYNRNASNKNIGVANPPQSYTTNSVIFDFSPNIIIPANTTKSFILKGDIRETAPVSGRVAFGVYTADDNVVGNYIKPLEGNFANWTFFTITD